MLPFLAEELQLILCSLLGCSLKEDLVDDSASPCKFPKNEISDEQNLFPHKRINIQFSVKDLGSELKESTVFQSGP